MVAVKGKIKASSLVEGIVAWLIILIVTLMGTVFYLKMIYSRNTDGLIEVSSYIDQELMNIEQYDFFITSTNIVQGFRVNKDVSEHHLYAGLYIISYDVLNEKGRLVLNRRRVVRKPNGYK